MLKDVYTFYYRGQAVALKTNFNLVGIACKGMKQIQSVKKAVTFVKKKEKTGTDSLSQCHYYPKGFVKFYSKDRKKALDTYFDGVEYIEVPLFGTEYCCVGPNNGIVLKFKNKTGKAEAAAIGEKHKLVLDKSEPLDEYLPNTFLFQMPELNPEACFEVSSRIYETEKDRLEFAEPDFLGKLMMSMPNASPTETNLQWALADPAPPLPGLRKDLRVAEAWGLIQNRLQSGNPITLQSVNIAIVDDGLHPHSDLLGGNVLPGKNYTSSNRAQTTPVNPNDIHGSQIAGLLAAAHNGVAMAGLGFTANGVSEPFCKVIPVRVCYDGGHFVSSSKIAYGIGFAAANARIVNMSFNFAPSFPGLANIDNAINAHPDTLFVASAGNFFPGDGNNRSVLPPANIPGVLTVAAHDRSGAWKAINNPTGSNWGSRIGSAVDVCAPGVEVTGTITGNNLSSNFGGTSAAAGFVSGVAALILAVKPSLKPAEVIQIIKSTAIDDCTINGVVLQNPADRANYVGSGRVNAENAVQVALT